MDATPFEPGFGLPFDSLDLTRHAERRSQQRAIRPALIDLLLTYGDRQPAGGGAEMIRIPRKRSRKGLADSRQADKLASIYAIVDGNGRVITVGHQFRRVWR
jgi:hypothetical protein